jgi:Carboxypeptidase regulatory-like domain/TonB-dependent Receptor Plug Domain
MFFDQVCWLRTLLRAGLLSLVLAEVSISQTTQGLIAGRVVDSLTGKPIGAARVSYSQTGSEINRNVATSSTGFFVIPSLSPGLYHVSLRADGYQGQELYELDLPIASQLHLNFRLRPLSDVWEQGSYRSFFLPESRLILPFFGPDMDPSHVVLFEGQQGTQTDFEFSLSSVVGRSELDDLPLAGRDTYALLLTQPGVNADTGTARGLGLTVNGQRPSSSNYLLDGLENNNYLTTGPLFGIAPEAAQEYRISISNFTAEYGGTSGFLANTSTRSGSERWHGLLYYYLKNESLNANGFQHNFRRIARPPVKESQPGFFAGGPFVANRLFGSLAFEWYRFRSRSDPETFVLPTPLFTTLAPIGSVARRLLQKFPALSDGLNATTVSMNIAPPTSLNRLLVLPRIDYVNRDGQTRLMTRLAISRLERPDFSWSPYSEFTASLRQNAVSAGANWLASFSPSLTNELRAGWSVDELGFDRPHPEIPTLLIGISDSGRAPPLLPGSSLYYSYLNRGRTFEANENLTWSSGRNVLKVGAGALIRYLDGFLTAGRDGFYSFSSVDDFLKDKPSQFIGSANRSMLPALTIPPYDRQYRYFQFSGFIQDDLQVSQRLVVNFGLRYENFGAPFNTGANQDELIHFGRGATFLERIASADFTPLPVRGNQRLFDADNRDFAARFGFAYRPPSSGRTVLRGGYGIYYDRPFDNLWQTLRNNNVALSVGILFNEPFNYLQPLPGAYTQLPNLQSNTSGFPQPTLFQPSLRNGYAQNLALALDHGWGRLDLSVRGTSSLGRRLITTDVINRVSVPTVLPPNRIYVMPNDHLPPLSYRANQGISDYYGLSVTGAYRSGRVLFLASYLWSHSIDEQSDALTGDFFDLQFADFLNHSLSQSARGFTRQFDNRGDRANSDFDQRQNVVVSSILDVPSMLGSTKVRGLLRDWKFSELAAFRSGLPYSVFVPDNFNALAPQLSNNRASIVDPARLYLGTPDPSGGGIQVLNPAGFALPVAGVLGNSGRNAFRGPGFYNVDVSLSRRFKPYWLGEAGVITLRSDVFNILNHTNLNNPDSFFSSPLSATFGVARFGRQGVSSGFPAVSPINDAPRQIQILLRIQF